MVSALRDVERLLNERRFSRSLSLLAPWQTVIFDTTGLPEARLVLALNDVTAAEPGYVPPNENIAAAIVEFGRACASDDEVLIHCWMGVSRSPAAAFIVACARAVGQERAIADALRRASPTATPNRLLVSLADDLLGRGGRMVDAIDAIGAGVAGDPSPFLMPLDWAHSAGQGVG